MTGVSRPIRLVGCDDRSPAAIRDAVAGSGILQSGAAQLDPLVPERLVDAITSLFNEVRRCLGEEQLPQNGTIENPLGGADILLLDYGLTQFPNFGVRLTAEHLAGYVRAFTDTPYVVSLNKLKNVDFDLKYLLGDFDTRADLALKTEHLATPGLWASDAASGDFCPWYWPSLLQAPARRRAQIDIVKRNVNEGILSTIGMPTACIPLLSRQAVAFLSPFGRDDASQVERRATVGESVGDAKDVREITFWDHFRSSNRTLPYDDRRDLLAKIGGDLESRDCPEDEALQAIVARVVAAELEFWFRRDVLGPQTLLIDAPHLQGRLKVKRSEGRNTEEEWSATAIRREPPYGLDNVTYGTILGEAVYKSPWLEAPAFWLPLIEATSEFERIDDEAERFNELHFCEDTRRFRDRSKTRRFVTDLSKGADIRFVERVNGFVYSPASLFAR